MDKSMIKRVPVTGRLPQAADFVVRPAICDLRYIVKGCFLFLFVFCILNVLGCATYKFQLGKKPYDKGYVVTRDDYAILEYTLAGDNSLPDTLQLAKERFHRRRKIVEHYYKKMGYIDNHFKMAFWNPCIYTLKTMRGLFRLPFVAISDYRYEHNPAYRDRITKLEEEKELRQEGYIQELKEKLRGYIEQRDMSQEEPRLPATAKEIEPNQEVVAQTLAHIEKKVAEKKPKPGLKKSKNAGISVSGKKELISQPVAVIIAKPINGLSPLTVRFYGYKSQAKGGKIVSYDWDFGDGDASTKINPTNIYYSGSFQPQYFDVTLTVKDDKGNSVQATTTIEVLNK